MVRNKRLQLVADDEDVPEVTRGFLRKIFQMESEQALKFLACHGVLHNNRNCSICQEPMGLVKAKDRTDGLKWRCSKCKGEKTVRDGSIFSKSKLPIDKLLLILYGWSTNWCNNTFLEEELEVTPYTAVKWLAECRKVCQEALLRMPKLGGPGIYVEMDQMCISKPKHHRGAPQATSDMWFQTFTERDGGRQVAILMEDRTLETIDQLVMLYVAEHTELISDEWPAHKHMKSRLLRKHSYKLGSHRMVKHKETFAKYVTLEDGTRLTVHTNKEEGLHAHLKRKMKYMMGTSRDHVEGYVAEALFKMNCMIANRRVFDVFLDEIQV